MGGQGAPQEMDPAVEQITEFISTSINDGGDPIEVVMNLVQQEVDQQLIAQAFMTVGYEEDDVLALFEQVQQKMQPPKPASRKEQTQDPQEIARNEAITKDAEMQQQQQMVERQDAMSQQLQAKSGIEIKPKNKGKFTKWAKARGMTVKEAYSKVMSNTKAYPPSVVQMANFAKNAAGWKKEEGGETAYMANRDMVIKREMAKAQSGSMKEGGEFEPHFMYKGDRKIRAKDMATHLRLKEAGYNHDAPKAETGLEIDDKGNRSIDGVVQSKDAWTTAPNYVNPLAFESGNNFSATDALQVLGTGYNKMFGSGDRNEDGLKDGAFRDLKGKRKRNQLRKGDYYNYEIDIDKNDPTSYGFDNLDLYNASNNNGNLRDLQTFTNDVNENSRANYNTETGKYDSIMSSRSLDKDVYGNLNAYSGKNLNYFKNVDQDTKQQILDYGNASKNGMPAGTTLSIDPTTGSISYVDPGSNNPNQYNTMMGFNKYGQSTPTNTPVETNTPSNAMIPSTAQGMFEKPLRGGKDNILTEKQGGGSMLSSAYKLATDDDYKWTDALYDNTLAPLSNALDVLSIPSALVAEAGEYFTGRGDGEFNFTDAMPGLKGDYSFTNMNDSPLKTLSGLQDDEGNPLVENFWGALALDMVSDPTTYVGAGVIKSLAKKGIAKSAPVVKNIIQKLKPNKIVNQTIRQIDNTPVNQAMIPDNSAATNFTPFPPVDDTRKLQYLEDISDAEFNKVFNEKGAIALQAEKELDIIRKAIENGEEITPGLRETFDELVRKRDFYRETMDVPDRILNSNNPFTNMSRFEIDDAINSSIDRPFATIGKYVDEGDITDLNFTMDYLNNAFRQTNAPYRLNNSQTGFKYLYNNAEETEKGVRNELNDYLSNQLNNSFEQSSKIDYGDLLKYMNRDGGETLPEAQFGIPNMFGNLNNYIANYDNGSGQQTFGDEESGSNIGFGNSGSNNNFLNNAVNFNNNTTQTTKANTGFQDPTVTRTNQFEGGLNRILDSPEMKGITDGSEFAVQGSRVVNNLFKDIAVNDAQVENHLGTGADYQYATLEDSMDKRGRWFNGTFGSEGQRTVAGAGTAQTGGSIPAKAGLGRLLKEGVEQLPGTLRKLKTFFGSSDKANPYVSFKGFGADDIPQNGPNAFNEYMNSFAMIDPAILATMAGLPFLEMFRGNSNKEKEKRKFDNEHRKSRGMTSDGATWRNQEGGEIANVDSTLLAKLIAAGADIEIL